MPRCKPTYASYTTAMDVQNGVIVAEYDKLYAPERGIRENRRRWKGGEIGPPFCMERRDIPRVEQAESERPATSWKWKTRGDSIHCLQ